MTSKKRRLILEFVSGAAERSRERAQKRSFNRMYYNFRDNLKTGIIPDFPAAVAFLAYHKFPCEVDMRFGFKRIKIGEYPVLMFNREGKYAGHDSTFHREPQKSVAVTNFFVDK